MLGVPVVFACVVLLTLLLIYVPPHESVKALRVHNLNSGLSYTTIQSAIDAPETTNGQVLLVDEGSYTENVVVDKSLTIKSDGQVNGTIVQVLDSKEPAFRITSDNVSLEGFSVKGSFSFVQAGRTIGAVYIRIGGITLTGCRNCDVFDNICFGNSFGIFISADNNSIHENTCTNNTEAGIGAYYSNNNTISKNLSFRNRNGVEMESSYYNLVTENYLCENTGSAVSLSSGESTDPNLAKKNTIQRNEMLRNEVAISLYCSAENTFTENNVSYNNYIFHLGYVNGDLIYHNNFVGNGANVLSGYDPHGTLRLDNGAEGNYWGSIHSMPYAIDGQNQDNHPLTKSYSVQ